MFQIFSGLCNLVYILKLIDFFLMFTSNNVLEFTFKHNENVLFNTDAKYERCINHQKCRKQIKFIRVLYEMKNRFLKEKYRYYL